MPGGLFPQEKESKRNHGYITAGFLIASDHRTIILPLLHSDLSF